MSDEHSAAPASEAERAPVSTMFANGGLSWRRVRVPRWLSHAAKLSYALGAVGALAAFGGWYGVAGIPALFLLPWPLFILSYVLSLTETSFRGGLEVARDYLAIESGGAKRRVISRKEIASALVVERHVFGAYVPTVEIELVSGDVLVARLADPTAARSIVEALGFGPGGTRLRVALGKPSRRLMNPLLAVIAYIAGAGAMILVGVVASALGATVRDMSLFTVSYACLPFAALAIYAGLKRLMRAPDITVGDDGVLVATRFGRRFVARRDIQAVRAFLGVPLVIDTKQGERVVVSGTLLDDARRFAVARAIEERAIVSVASADRFAHYERGERPLGEWRAHLGRAMNEATYRANAAATVDEASAVLRSAEATPEQRVGAALALRVAGQPKERIRVAVDAAVDERVREALAAIAEEEDDAAIEHALRRLR